MRKSAAPDDGEAYIVRDAPAGQTLRDLVKGAAGGGAVIVHAYMYRNNTVKVR